MTTSTSQSFTSSIQALTPLTPASTSSLSSSSSASALSRASSVHSTASVSAVPFRNPVRGPVSGGLAMQRQGSGGVGRNFDSAGVGAATSYFERPPPPSSARASYQTAAGMLSPGGTLVMSSANDSQISYGSTSSNGLQPQMMATGLTNWSAVGLAVGEASRRPSIDPAEEKRDEEPLAPPTRPPANRPASMESLSAMRKTITDFRMGEMLGEGSYSTVLYVTDVAPPHKAYALKVLNKEHILREKKTKYVLIERDTLKKLDGHPGIVRLYWTFQDKHSLYYVLELAKNGELLKWIKKFGSFSIPSARFYAAQILSAVEHMHAKGVIHRDLKPENILLDWNMRVKVTDFGTAKVLDDSDATIAANSATPPVKRTRSFVGTPEYVSPEILSEGKESSPSSDYWGFGCILFQIIAGRPPFIARTEYLMFQKIIKLDYDFPEGFPADAKDLVKKLLVLDPRKRLGGGPAGIDAIKAHPFFSGLDFASIWEVEPPPIETGLAPPKPEQVGEFVMPEGFDSFDDVSDGLDEGAYAEEESVESSSPTSPTAAIGFPRLAPLQVNGRHSNGPSSPTVTAPADPVTKWTGVLRPKETIVLASPILDRTGFLSKRRSLILTDTPRLLCIKETATRVTLKSEVFLGPGPTSSRPPSPVAATFVKATTDGEKGFTVRTSQRTFKYEDPSGSAARWVAELTESHTRRAPAKP